MASRANAGYRRRMDAMSQSLNRAAPDEGDFYVETDCCLLCGVPEDLAPEIFETGENHCFVKRQPCSQDEIDKAIRAMWSSEVDCIRYRGRDAKLLDRMAQANMSDQADHPLRPDAPVVRRDRVCFAISIETSLPKTAAQIASEFRADMRADGNVTLPRLFGRRTVWVSWFQNRFHRVRFIDEGGGCFVVHLKSRVAFQGLAWLMHDWLRARGAERIRWEAAGDSKLISPTPM